MAYVTADGFSLGRWLRRQIDTGERLSEEKKEKLLSIGVNFEKPDAWEEKFALLKRYYEEHGDLKIPADYVVNGVWLARWFTEQKARLNGRSTGRSGKKKTLTEEQEKKLLSLGVRKDISDNDVLWLEQYACAKEFFKENGHLNIPKNYISPTGKAVGRWLAVQRRYQKTGKLSEKRSSMLNELGIDWASGNDPGKVIGI